ncbi:hypothetical protein DPEC_G00268200 [Dallia pectoralis]|uniref:Uncharacterized protein n=1 Tax=Dallia pectoralis TaxID=75939 RepID=A0ACC2FNT8_DALPE|nr:hypothetical protein DPEC_G00268200 [Dallia pectoralis]
MEGKSSCNGGQKCLGLRFTIDYLLYNKDKKSMREEPHCSSAEQTFRHPREKQRPDVLLARESVALGRHDMGPEREGEATAEKEKKEDRESGEGERELTTTDCPQDKPRLSYIALISMAILASEEKKLLLCDIYQWILDNYSYFKSKDKNWRNSVRHNLSLNECFMKAGRSDTGKGHFWAIHPASFQDFSNGDYHRRRARRRVRRLTGHLPYAPHANYFRHDRPTGVPCPCVSPAHLLSSLPARIY